MTDPINPSNENLNISPKIVRTYSSDLTKSVQEKGGEAYRIARVEQGIKEKEAKIEAHQNKYNLIFGLGGFLFIILALAAFIYFNSLSKVKINPEPITTVRPIIFFDNKNTIEISGLDKTKIRTAIQNLTNKSKFSSGDITQVTFTENGQSVSILKLLSALEINAPQELRPYLEKDYFFGLFTETIQNFPFMILRTNSYADISPSIIDWEVHMLDDFNAILGINVAGENNYLLQNKFSSTIVSNKETKAIKNKDGEVILMYLFLDERNILIARNKNTLDEVLLRLYSPKK